MKVLMVGVDRNRIGGMWTVAETFIKNEWFNRQVELYYVATSTCGSRVRRVARMLKGYMEILGILATKRIDLVHIHMAEKGSVYRKGAVVYLAKLFGKKVVVQMHAGPILLWYNGLSDRRKRLVSAIFNRADRMLVLGEYWKKQLSSLVGADKIEVLYNASECPPENPYNAGGTSILYLGILKKSKGIFDLLDAIKLIDSALPETQKVYLCGADEAGAAAKYVRELRLEKRVVMPGWIDKNRRLELFQDAQFCVLPSYSEGLSMTVIEAMCSGIPMVTTNITTMPELLGDEIEMVRPGDVQGLAKLMLKLAGNRTLREKISGLEYRRAKEYFSVDRMMQRTLAIYKEVME